MPSKVSVRAHAIIAEGRVYRNSIAIYSPDEPGVTTEIFPFSTEIHSTTSYNGIIIFAPVGYHLPPELDMPHVTAVPGNFTEMLNRIAEAVPSCFDDPHTVILLPL